MRKESFVKEAFEMFGNSMYYKGTVWILLQNGNV